MLRGRAALRRRRGETLAHRNPARARLARAAPALRDQSGGDAGGRADHPARARQRPGQALADVGRVPARVRLARARDASDIIEEAQQQAAGQLLELSQRRHATNSTPRPTPPCGRPTSRSQSTARPARPAAPRPTRTTSAAASAASQLGVSDSTARLTRDTEARSGARGKWVVAGLVGLFLALGPLIFCASRARWRAAAPPTLRMRTPRTRMPRTRIRRTSTPPAARCAAETDAHRAALGAEARARAGRFELRRLQRAPLDRRRVRTCAASARCATTRATGRRPRRPMRTGSSCSFDRARPPRGRLRLLGLRPQPLPAGPPRRVANPRRGRRLAHRLDRRAWRQLRPHCLRVRPRHGASLRILQPAQQGPQNRSFIMWVREVKVYAAGGSPE